VRLQPLIAVTDVGASSRWYQRLLGCRSNHGGRAYEQLVSNGKLLLQLYSFEVEYHRGPTGDPHDKPYGNGVLLWFEVDAFDAVVQRSAAMGVESSCPGIGIRQMVTGIESLEMLDARSGRLSRGCRQPLRNGGWKLASDEDPFGA
jgi:hypothetical protein